MCTSCEWRGRGMFAAASAAVAGGIVSLVLDPKAPWQRRALDTIVAAGTAYIAVGETLPSLVTFAELGVAEEQDLLRLFGATARIAGGVFLFKVLADLYPDARRRIQ